MTTVALDLPPTVRDRMPAVAVEGLTKRFGSTTAVDALSFELPRGVVAGFIGPNGAGKTTTMAMLLGLVAPTSGTGTVLGHPLEQPAAYLHHVGALIESPAFWPYLTGEDNLRLVATLAGHDTAGIPGVLELVGLTERAGDRFGDYSFGMKQRLGIAAALLGDPALLILDEPTNGLDPAGMNEMRQLIAGLAGDDRTVLVSSHLLGELEQICDWLVIIEHGSLVYQGPAGGFLDHAATVLALAAASAPELARLARLVAAEGYDARIAGDRLLVSPGSSDPTTVATLLNRVAFEGGIVLSELHVERPTLESHYLAMVEGGR